MGWHRTDVQNEVQTPNMDALVKSGIELDQYYVHKYCSPSRSSYQSGRLPYHVNVVNVDMNNHNPANPVAGFAGVRLTRTMPRPPEAATLATLTPEPTRASRP